MDSLRVEFPQGKIYVKQSSGGKDIIDSAYIEWNQSYNAKLNRNFNQTQMFLDNKVVQELQPYVSKKTGVQELSIRLRSVPGSGEVWIGVPYAHYQAYSPRIRKSNGKRGKKPWERMVEEKKDMILKQVAEYSRRNL